MVKKIFFLFLLTYAVAAPIFLKRDNESIENATNILSNGISYHQKLNSTASTESTGGHNIFFIQTAPYINNVTLPAKRLKRGKRQQKRKNTMGMDNHQLTSSSDNLLTSVKEPVNKRKKQNDKSFAARDKNVSIKINSEKNQETVTNIGDDSQVVPSEEECYFSQLRRTAYETQERSAQSEVSTSCSKEHLISIGDLLENHISLHGTTSEAQIIIERGAGEFGLDYGSEDVKKSLRERKLCKNHRNELFTRWSKPSYKHIIHRKSYGNKTPVCSLDERYESPHSLRPFITKNSYTVDSSTASAFLQKFGILLHVGLPVCERHGKKLKQLAAKTPPETNDLPDFDDPGLSPVRIDPEEENCGQGDSDDDAPLDSAIGQYQSSSDSSTEEDSDDPDYKSRVAKKHLNRPQIDVTPSVLKSFLDFAEAAGYRDRATFSRDFDMLKPRSQKKKVCQYRSFMDVVATIMAGKNKDMLKSMAVQKNMAFSWQKSPNPQMDLMLAYIKAQYNAASNRETRLAVLAQVAFAVPLETLQTVIPGISRRFYTTARRKAKERFVCWNDKKNKKKVTRYNVDHVNKFIDFISSPPISTMLPSRYVTVKKPDGTKTSIPPVMRRHHHGEIINIYDSYLIETQQTEWSLSEYVMRTILKVCSAKTQKSLHCVDNFVVDAEEAFDGMKNVVKILHEKNYFDEEWAQHLDFGLQESHNYLKGDYFMQVKMASRIGDLCIMYALSDPFDKSYQATDCASRNTQPHEHDLQTDRIRLLDRTLIDLRMTLGSLIQHSTDRIAKIELEDMREDILRFEKLILEWKKHLVRAAYSNYNREEIINNLQEGEALITIDYAQKYLPRHHLERQADFYGKKGLSWQISHILAVVGGEYVQHTIVHLLGEDDQDSQAVIAILRDVFVKAKKWNIHAITFRSDNASYYKNAQLLVSLPYIAQDVGVNLKRYSFSESQFGKADADREAGRMKQRMNFAVNQGANIQTAEEMLDAITSGTIPLSGLTVVVAKIQYDVVQSKASIPLITNLYDFEYDENYVKFWRHYNIGTGKKLKLQGFENAVVRPSLDIIKEWDHSPDDPSYTFWMSTRTRTETADSETVEDIAEEAQTVSQNFDVEDPPNYNPKKLFSCPVPNCIKQFYKLGNCNNHVTVGKHVFEPESLSLQEYAFNVYRTRLEGTAKTTLQMLENRNTETGDSMSVSQPKEGWALKSPKSNIRYTTEMREFLDKKIEEYLDNKEYFNAKEVEKSMAELKARGRRVFSAEQRLNYRQIAAYYRRKVKRIQEQMAQNTQLSEEEQALESESIIQEMNDETGDIELELEDEAYFLDEAFYNREAISDLDFNNMNEDNIDQLYDDEAELAALFVQPSREEAQC